MTGLLVVLLIIVIAGGVAYFVAAGRRSRQPTPAQPPIGSRPPNQSVPTQSSSLNQLDSTQDEIPVRSDDTHQRADAASVEERAPKFSDPDDALRWDMVHAVRMALQAMMDQYEKCFEQAQNVEKAFGMANADYVDGVQQHPLSKASFRNMAVEMEAGLERELADLQGKTNAAAEQWGRLLFLLPGDDHDVMKVVNWCSSNGVPAETMGAVAGNGIFVFTDFGLTRESFWTENDRVASVMNRSGE